MRDTNIAQKRIIELYGMFGCAIAFALLVKVHAFRLCIEMVIYSWCGNEKPFIRSLYR